MSKPELIQWSNVKLYSMAPDTIQERFPTEAILNCFDSEETVILAPYPNSFEKAEQFCTNLNGFMPLPRNLSHLADIFANSQKAKIVEKCSNKFWIPIRRFNESKWVDRGKNATEVNYLPWTKHETSVKFEHEDCAYVIIDGPSMNYSESSCEDDLCFACQVPNQRLTFTLKVTLRN
jgi:hypothetical protein